MGSYTQNMLKAVIASRDGGIVRRSRKLFKQDPRNLKELKRIVKQKKWHLIATKDQYIVICRSGKIGIVV